MITSGLMYVILSTIQFFVGFLPIVQVNDNIATALAPASSYISSVNAVFPVMTLMSIVSFVLLFDSIWILYLIIRWAYRKIPTIS